MTREWYYGVGPDYNVFTPDSAVSQVMAQSAGVQSVLEAYNDVGSTSNNYEFGAPGFIAAGANPVAQFVGSFTWSITPANGGINLVIGNRTSVKSLLDQHGPQYQRPTVSTPFGDLELPLPGGNTYQTINIFVPCTNN